jgi:ferritin
MKMNQDVLQALVKGIHQELETAYNYEAMELWLIEHHLDGMAHWMNKQVAEEREHAHKIREYLQLRGEKITLHAIGAPKATFSSPLEIFEAVLKAEKEVSAAIIKLQDLANANHDNGAGIFLDWFVREQEEEESDVQRILDKFTLAGITQETKNGAALYLLDKELGAR